MKKLISTFLFLFVVAIFSSFAQTDIYAPTLSEPEDGDDDQMPNVVLDWYAVSGSGGIVMYDLELDVTDAFSSPVPFYDLEFSGQQMENLLFGQEYFWRVRAKEGTDISDWSETFSFIIFEMVSLDKPNDGSEEIFPNADLKCKQKIGSADITGIDYFEFEADTADSFDSPVLFHGTSPTRILKASFLRFGTEYYWRARVAHGADNSSWSEVRTFETIPTTNLFDPEDNSADLGLGNTFGWGYKDNNRPIGGVLDWEIQIADNETFSGAYSKVVEEQEYYSENILTFNTEYWWRVRGNHATDTSDWSEVFQFETIGSVQLTSPEDGAVDISITPILEWEPITGVDTFYLVYGTTPGLENPIAEMSINGDQNIFQIIYILDKDQSYYWKCRALNGIDTTDWSDTWMFATEPEVSINEAFDENNIKIYPNPSNGKLIIDVAGEENTQISIYIMDLLGQVHVEETAVFGQNSTRSFDLSNLANGLYLVKLNKGNYSYTHKITIYK